MANIRLSDSVRVGIVGKMLRHRFNNDVVALMADRGALALDIYEDAFSAADRSKMDSLPKGWLTETTVIKAQLGPDVQEMSFNGYEHLSAINHAADIHPDKIFRRIPDQCKSRVVKVYDMADPFCRRFEALSDRRKSLITAIREAETLASAVLRKVHSVGKLLEVWPEVRPFLPAEPAKVLLPAIPLASVNEMFRLPVVGGAA